MNSTICHSRFLSSAERVEGLAAVGGDGQLVGEADGDSPLSGGRAVSRRRDEDEAAELLAAVGDRDGDAFGGQGEAATGHVAQLLAVDAGRGCRDW